MPEETYRVYSALKTHLLSSHVRQIGTDIEGLHSALDDMLSLLVWVKRDLDNYLDHNPCQVCSSLRELGRVFTEARRNEGGPEDSAIPTPPYQSSSCHSGVPGSLGERVEGDHIATPASLPSLIPNSSSSLSSQFTDGDEVSVSGSYSHYTFTEFGCWLSQQSRVHQPGGFPGEEDSFPMGNSFSPWIPSTPPIPYDSSLHNELSSIHSHESRILSGFFDSPSQVPSSGESSSSHSLSYFSPGPFSGGYSASPSSNPFHQASQEEVCSQEEERAAALALALERLKKVFKDYLKEFGAEEVEEEVMGQLGHSLKGKHNPGPCKACQAGGWCSNLHHCYQDMGEAGGPYWFLNVSLTICTMYLTVLEYICPQSWDLDLSLVCSKILRVLYVTDFSSYVLDFGGPKVNS